jgi:hypothetical protein
MGMAAGYDDAKQTGSENGHDNFGNCWCGKRRKKIVTATPEKVNKFVAQEMGQAGIDAAGRPSNLKNLRNMTTSLTLRCP